MGVAGCAQEENVILLEVQSPEDLDSVRIQVIPLDHSASPAATTRDVNRTADELAEQPAHVAIRLGAPRTVMVVLSAEAPDGTTLVAQRCMAVAGAVRDSVWMVPLAATDDGDGDGFSPRGVAGCARPPAAVGGDPVTCSSDDAFLCSAVGEVDCDDEDGDVYPGAPEICGNSRDEDCSGADATCEDADGDGFAPCQEGQDAATCDCLEGNADVHPGAADPCADGVDTDCDGFDDDCDADCDGYPDVAATYGDCNDDDAAIHPNASLDTLYERADGDRVARGCEPEPAPSATLDVCTMGSSGEPVGDGADNDCNGLVDDGDGCTDTTDRDRDGAHACTGTTTTGCDLDDCDPGISTTATEICGNAFDENSDGEVEACQPGDSDGDGYIGSEDCSEGDANVYLGAAENCITDASESCSENLPCTAYGGDADGDGYLTGLPSGVRGDCNDADATVHPGAAEVACDGVDNDCDGIADEVLGNPAMFGCVRTGGRATGVDYTASAAYSEYCGGCGVTTTASQDCCSGTPEEIGSPTQCGACGRSCGPNTGCTMTGTTADGNAYGCTCAPDTTEAHYADCNATLDDAAGGGDGCEVNLLTDENNCGECGLRCGSHQTCVTGSCECDSGYLDCDGSRDTGCEINGQNDAANCNGCGTVCAFDHAEDRCVTGTCRVGVCDAGYDNCDGSATNTNGCETALNALPNCGGCGLSCGGVQNATEICSASRTCDYSSCDANYGDCNTTRTDGCEVNLTSTVTACGSCSTNCNTTVANATGRSCSGSACNYASCSANYGDCDSNRTNGCEVNLSNTLTNCGTCGTNCSTTVVNASGRVCSSSACNYSSCTSGYGDCDSNRTNGCETNTTSTVTACGSCSNNCSTSVANATPTCTSGTCGYSSCNMGYASCDSNTTNGCEAALTSTATCGSCTNNCTTTVVNATPTCTSGTCGYSSCNSGYGNCDSNTTNGCEAVFTALATCGSCSNNCTTSVVNVASRTCTSGVCGFTTCSAGFGNCDANATNGCETATTTTTNCGTCGNDCTATVENATATCSSGACGFSSCNSGYASCDGDATDGCETNTQTDEDNCGACGVACGTNETCTAGRCVCGSTTGSAGSEACITPTTNCCMGMTAMECQAASCS